MLVKNIEKRININKRVAIAAIVIGIIAFGVNCNSFLRADTLHCAYVMATDFRRIYLRPC